MKHLLFFCIVFSIKTLFSQSAGSLDFDFNGTGIWRNSISPDNDVVYDIAVDNQQKIILGGFADSINSASSPLTIVRLNPDGSYDNSFSSDGVAQTMIGSTSVILKKLLVQTDRKIVAVAEGNNQLAIARFNVNGSLDDSFSFDGKVLTSAMNYPKTAALDKDGNIFVLGNKGIMDSVLVIAKFLPDGSLDQNFGSNGIKTTTMVYAVEPIKLIVDDNGLMYVGGWYLQSQFGWIFMTRLLANGDVDFNYTGTLRYSPVSFTKSAYMTDFIRSKDGGFIAVARVGDGIGMVRFASNGKLVAQFGNGGRVETTLGTKQFVPNGVAEQIDGKILVGGHGINSSFEGFFMATRINEAGLVDNTFGNNGLKLIEMSNLQIAEAPLSSAACLQADGRFLIAGRMGTNNKLDMCVARVLPGEVLSNNKNEQSSKLDLRFSRNTLFANLQQNMRFDLFDFCGRRISEVELTEGSSSVNFNYLPAGFYFMSSGGNSFKFMVEK